MLRCRRWLSDFESTLLLLAVELLLLEVLLLELVLLLLLRLMELLTRLMLLELRLLLLLMMMVIMLRRRRRRRRTTDNRRLHIAGLDVLLVLMLAGVPFVLRVERHLDAAVAVILFRIRMDDRAQRCRSQRRRRRLGDVIRSGQIVVRQILFVLFVVVGIVVLLVVGGRRQGGHRIVDDKSVVFVLFVLDVEHAHLFLLLLLARQRCDQRLWLRQRFVALLDDDLDDRLGSFQVQRLMWLLLMIVGVRLLLVLLMLLLMLLVDLLLLVLIADVIGAVRIEIANVLIRIAAAAIKKRIASAAAIIAIIRIDGRVVIVGRWRKVRISGADALGDLLLRRAIVEVCRRLAVDDFDVAFGLVFGGGNRCDGECHAKLRMRKSKSNL